MDAADRIAELIQPTVEDLGFDLVRVQVIGGRRMRLQIMIERLDGAQMVVDDCARVSRALSPILDVEGPIADSYTLEVSSPGLDRPLVRLKDYERFAGSEAKVELGRPIGGRRRFQGRLLGLDGSEIRVQCGDTEFRLPFEDVNRAKLVLTDDLLAGSK